VNRNISSVKYTTSATASVYKWIPGSPAWIGVGIATVLLIVFLVSGNLFGDVRSTSGDFRLAIIHILLSAYVPSAYVYLISVTKNVAQDMAPLFGHESSGLNRIGSHVAWKLMLVGFIGALVDVYATTVTTVGDNPWIWQDQNFDARWMRILGPLFSGWISCLFYVLAVESWRLSKLSDDIGAIDLLDLLPYRPLIRLGLTNVLLVVGLASIFSLFLLEPGFATLVAQLSIPFLIFAWVGLMLPLQGIRKKIKIAKQQELDWCTQALMAARNQIKASKENNQGIAEIIAYKTLIENIRNWPFDNPTLARFALYLLIPIGSMFGGAFVERGLDFLLR
jgi:hypothetical protein